MFSSAFHCNYEAYVLTIILSQQLFLEGGHCSKVVSVLVPGSEERFCEARDKDNSIQKAFNASGQTWLNAHNAGKRIRETSASRYAARFGDGVVTQAIVCCLVVLSCFI